MLKVPTINTPTGYNYIESCLHRCLYPVTKYHLSFLKYQLGSLKYILNYSNEILYDDIDSYINENGIIVHNIVYADNDILSLKDFVTNNIQLLIEICRDNVVLLIGNQTNFLDCVIISCLRKLLQWSYFNIWSEFRFLIGKQRRLQDLEEFIEWYEPGSSLSLPPTNDLPAFLRTHIMLLEEEWVEREEEDYKATRTWNLLHGNAESLVSAGVVYDADLSLIDDKDDED